MSDELPLISVIIPAYNADTFISDTLNSVLNQTYINLEVMVVDDGSQDRTAEIVESFAQSDCRVRLIRQSNAGVAAARNLAIQKSQGEFIAPIDADDIWFPQKLEKQMQLMLKAEASVGLIYAWSVDIDENNLLTGGYCAFTLEGKIYPVLIYRNILGSASVPLIRRNCLEQVGYYNCNFKKHNAQGCEDTDLYIRIAEYYKFRVVPEFLIGYRKSFSSMSCNCITMAKSHLLVLADAQRRHPEIPSSVYKWSKSNFYMFLGNCSRLRNDHKSAVFWLFQALQIDFTNFLRGQMYKMIFNSSLNVGIQSTVALIELLTSSSLVLKNKSNPTYRLDTHNLTISTLKIKATESNEKQVWKPHEKIMLQRWQKVIQMCQTSF